MPRPRRIPSDAKMETYPVPKGMRRRIRRLLSAINAERRKAGLRPLTKYELRVAAWNRFINDTARKMGLTDLIDEG